MTGFKIVAALAAAAVVSGCMKVEDYPQRLNEGTVSLSARKGFDAARLIETQPKIIRTMVATGEDGKGRKEVRGAKCELSTPELYSKSISPQLIKTPVIKGKPGQMVINCKLGEMSGQQVLPPNFEYRSTSLNVSGSNQAVVAGLLIGLAINAAQASSAKKKDEWQYFTSESQEIRILLK